MGKPRLNLRLRADLHRKLEEATRRPGVTKNAVIEQALAEYFEPALKMEFEARVLKRLDAFDIRQGEIERDVAISLETLGQFVLYWLTRTDPVPEGEREIAHALGQRRFDHFIEQVARKVTGGQGLAAKIEMKDPSRP
jgi:predicted transcriptional regulator